LEFSNIYNFEAIFNIILILTKNTIKLFLPKSGQYFRKMNKMAMDQLLAGMGGGGKSAGMNDKDEETKMEHKVSDCINKMDDEIKDRFKALKMI